MNCNIRYIQSTDGVTAEVECSDYEEFMIRKPVLRFNLTQSEIERMTSDPSGMDADLADRASQNMANRFKKPDDLEISVPTPTPTPSSERVVKAVNVDTPDTPELTELKTKNEKPPKEV